MTSNPLAIKQRETKGAETFGKYDYQYHWALCRLLDQHSANPEYAIFVEHHEDVVLADCLDAEKARFEFNQIKCKDAQPFTVIELTKVPKDSKNSILGKLLSSVAGKPFAASISSVNLVATNGFHGEIPRDGLRLDIIAKTDMSPNALTQFTEKMKTELGIQLIPENLRFIVPALPSKGHQDFVVGKIARLIEALFPESACKPANIYRVLIDELYRKGQIQEDFPKWEDMLDRKSLTSETVKSVVEKNTSIADLEEAKTEFDKIVMTINVGQRAGRKLKQEMVRYYSRHIAQPSPLHISLSRIVKEAAEAMPSLEYVDLIKYVEDRLDGTIKVAFNDTQALKAAIIYEIIKVENEQ